MSAEDEEELEHAEAMEGREAAGVTPDEFAIMLAQTHYLLRDEDIMKVVQSDPRLTKLVAHLSHMLRTTRIDDRTTLKRMKLRWRIACRLELLILAENPASLAEYYCWVNYGEGVIEDTWQGWRGKLTTERIRTYKIERGAPKRKKFLGLF